jgi:hypothetical protein
VLAHQEQVLAYAVLVYLQAEDLGFADSAQVEWPAVSMRVPDDRLTEVPLEEAKGRWCKSVVAPPVRRPEKRYEVDEDRGQDQDDGKGESYQRNYHHGGPHKAPPPVLCRLRAKPVA